MRPGHLPDYDIPRGFPRHSVGHCIVRCVQEKGFCVLDAQNWIEESLVRKARDAVGDLRFSRPSSSIAPALLGDYGSAQTATLEASTVDGPLVEVDAIVSNIFHEMRQTGYAISQRSATLIHETGELKGDDLPLDETSTEEWLNVFKDQKIMCLIGLGPGKGTLQLEPFLDEDAEPFDIPTGPGVIVVLRADVLLHTHRSIWTSYVMSSFFLCSTRHLSSGAPTEVINPTAQALMQSRNERLRTLREHAKNDALETVPKDIPRVVQKEINHLFLKGEAYAVHGVACNLPANRMGSSIDAYLVGLDTVTEIPPHRWDIDVYYDPDPECWKHGKSWTKHMSCIEGLELFDNKLFQISPAESQGMDPQQRQILEVGYECFHTAGMVRNNIMNCDCGFFLGNTMPEYQHLMPGVGGDLAVMANRISFCLGMKGPNLCLDADHASPLICMSIGTHELDKGCSQIMAQGCYLNFIPMFWPSHMQGHLLSHHGRCMSFDSRCDGSIRCDGIGSMYSKKFVHKVDDEDMETKSSMPIHAVIVGSKFENQGRCSGFTSPHGPSLSSVVMQALHGSKVSPLDIDAIECDAKGRLMDDAVEVAAIMKVLRPLKEDGDEPLPFQAVKSSWGNSWYASGMQAFLRAIAAGTRGVLPPVLHLKQINPMCEDMADDRPASFSTERLETRGGKNISGIMACGWGGTNAYLQVWTEAEVRARKTNLALSFWPGGGGTMNVDAEPYDYYTIIGSWSGWSKFEVMQSEGDGKYGFTVTLGANRWEMFQIMLDGDASRVLHPKQYQATKGTGVYGPEEVGRESTWMIDGRAVQSLDEEGAIVASDDTMADTSDTALPGTRFRIELHEVGKWRYLSWEKLESSRYYNVIAREDVKALICGTYYVNLGGELVEMVGDSNNDGVYTAIVSLERDGKSGGAMHILRNADPCQTFYPQQLFASSGDTQIYGPDEGYDGGCWFVNGSVGDVFKVTFERRLGDSGIDAARKVCWEPVEPPP